MKLANEAPRTQKKTEVSRLDTCSKCEAGGQRLVLQHFQGKKYNIIIQLHTIAGWKKNTASSSENYVQNLLLAKRLTLAT